MITCVISEKNVRILRKNLFRRLKQNAKANVPFNLKDYMTEIYTKISDKVVDEEAKHDTALSYAGLMPKLVQQALSVPQFVNGLAAQNFDFNEALTLYAQIKDSDTSLNDIESFLGIDMANAAAIISQHNATNTTPSAAKPPVVTEKEAVAKTPSRFLGQYLSDLLTLNWRESLVNRKDSDKDARLPFSPMYDYIRNDQGEWRESRTDPNNFYFKVKRKLIDRFIDTGYDPDNMKIKVGGIEIDIFLTAKSVTSVDSEELSKDIDLSKDTEGNGVLMFVTDASGTPLRFDANGDISLDGSGKMAHYQIRAVRPGNISLNEQDRFLVKRLAKESYNNDVAAATIDYTEQLKMLQSMRQYIHKNKTSNMVKTRINGGTRGYAIRAEKNYKPISSFDFEMGDTKLVLDFATVDEPSKGLKKGFTYITNVNGFYGQPLEVERPRVSGVTVNGKPLQDKIISLAVDAIQDKNGVKYPLDKRRELLDFFIMTRPDGIQLLENDDVDTTDAFLLRFKGEIQDLSTPEARAAVKEKLNKYFNEYGLVRKVSKPTNVIEEKESYTQDDLNSAVRIITEREGEPNKVDYWLVEKPQLHVLGKKANTSYLNSNMPDIELNTDENGDVIMTPAPEKKYSDFILENYGLKYYQEDTSSNKLRKYDAYFTFAPTKEAIEEMTPAKEASKIANKVASTSKVAAEELVKKRKAKAVSDIAWDIREDKNDVGTEFYETIYTDLNDTVHHIQKEYKEEVLAEINKLANRDLAAATKVVEPKVDDSLSPGGHLKLGNTRNLLGDASALDKLDTVKAKDMAATEKQLAAIPEWWAKHPLSKHVPMEAMFDMINTENPSSVANWTTAGITLYKGSDYSDLYHESWHSFTQSFLTKEQKKDLYNEARKKKGSFVDHLGKYVTFSSASDLQLEEYMAEEFRKYMLKGGKKKITEPVKKNIFAKIWDALKTIFANSTSQEIMQDARADATINELYEKMRVGNLSEYTFSQENVQFGTLNKGMEASNKEGTQHVLSYENSQLLSDTVSSLLSEWVNESNAGLTQDEMLEKADLTEKFNDPATPTSEKLKIEPRLKVLSKPKTYKFSSALYTNPKMQLQAYQYAHAMIGKLYNQMVDKMNATENGQEKRQLNKDRELLLWAYNNFGNLESLTANVPLEGKPVLDVMGYHMSKNEEFLGQAVKEAFGDVQTMTEQEIAEKGKKFEIAGNERSMTDIATKDILFLFRGLHKLDSTTKKPVLNRLGAKELVDFEEVWNRTARTLTDTIDGDVMYTKLSAEAQDYPIFQQILNKLGPISSAENVEQTNLWTNFINPFSMARIPLIQMTLTKVTADNKPTTWDSATGNATGGSGKILRGWQSALSLRPLDAYTLKDEAGNYLNLPAIVKNFSMSANAPASTKLKGREIQFLRALGLDVTDNPRVLDIIKDTSDGKAITFLMYRAIALNKRGVQVRNFKDLTRKYLEDKATGEPALPKMESRIKSIAVAHSRFSDKANSMMVTNAENNTQFENSLNNSLSVMITAINDAVDYKALMQMPHMAHLNVDENPFAKASTWLNSIFVLDVEKSDPTHGMKRGISASPGAPKVKIDFSNLSGALIMEDESTRGEGIASAKADEVTKLILDFHLSFQSGVSEVMRHADKSTSYAATLKHILNPKTKQIKNRYIDTTTFLSDSGEVALGQRAYDEQAYDYIMPHLSAEVSRINKLRDMKNPQDIDFKYWAKGKEFVTFKDVLSENTRARILNNRSGIGNLEEYLSTEEGSSLQSAIREDFANYFQIQSDNVSARFAKNDFIADNVLKDLRTDAQTVYGEKATVGVTEAGIALTKSYVYNTWINNIEQVALFYGDLALYNHAKEEFHKRNAGMGSTGTLYRTDDSFKKYINNQPRVFTEMHGGKQRTYDGTLNTAIIQDSLVKSVYYDEYVEIYTKHYKDSGMSDKAAKAKAEKELATYGEDRDGNGAMEEGDAQGWISFDSYRILKLAEGKWGDAQQKLYDDIVDGKRINPVDVLEFFPVIKAQYYGPLQNNMDGLPITAMHKYSLLPLIPTVIAGTNLQNLHTKMMNEGIDYSVYQTGSKVGTITKKGTPDKFYENGRNETSTEPFTKNVIYVNYLKNQLEIASKFKTKGVPFPTQLRKLIEDGLMTNGVPSDFEAKASVETRMKKWNALKTDKARFDASPNYKLVKEYEDNIRLLTDIAKQKLLSEMQWTSKMENGVEVLDGNLENLLTFVKDQLSRQDMAEHEIDFLQMEGQSMRDLSLSLSVDKIEKMLNALVMKKLVNQHVTGQGLVQISGSMFESIDSTNRDYANPTKEDMAQYGSNDLPTYTSRVSLPARYKGMDQDQLKEILALKQEAQTMNAKNWVDSKRAALRQEISYLEDVIAGKKPKVTEIQGTTAAMKVKVAMQGEFLSLLEAKHTDGKRIGTTARLNKMLKDEVWLNTGRNREMITMVGVRIPVQGMNSMEFMEVYEFLPAEAGAIIIPPAEIVAKSGSDFDIDKLTILMPNLKKGRGVRFTSMFNYTTAEADAAYKEYLAYKAAGVVKTNTGNLQKTERLDKLNQAFAQMMGMTIEEMNQNTVDELIKEGRVMDKPTFLQTLVGSKSVQNDLISNMVDILSLPQNFMNLTKPNSTDIFTNSAGTGIADEIGPDVIEYDPKVNIHGDPTEKGVTGTRALEVEYNLYKHAANNVGKQALGLAAVDNTYNTVFNRIGFRLNATAGVSTKRHKEMTAIVEAVNKRKKRQEMTADEKKLADKWKWISNKEKKAYENYHRQTLFLPHNTITVDGEKAISLSHDLDARGEHRVADVINQLLNGWLDVAKDTWIFNIQGNKEVSPILLFLLQSGVPAKSAVYFASMPIIRDYVAAQRDAKGTFAEPLGKAPMDTDSDGKEVAKPFWFRGKAKDEILSNPKYGFGISPDALGGKRIKTINKEAIIQVKDEVLNNQGHLDDTQMRARIKDYSAAKKANKEYIYNDLDRAAFLHFLEVEAMAQPVLNVKMNTNFDTSKTASLFEARNRIVSKELLSEDSRFPMEMIDKIINDSPIGSFFVQEFQVDLLKDLFNVRSHPAITDFLLDKIKNDKGFNAAVSSTYGDTEKFANEFVNNFISHIYQTGLRDFDINASHFKGYEISEEFYTLKTEWLKAETAEEKKQIQGQMARLQGAPVEKVTYLKQGISRALKKTDDGTFLMGKRLYIDRGQLKKQWDNKEFRSKSYTEKGLAKVNFNAFTTAKEYYQFVFEREVLRRDNTLAEAKQGVEYATLRNKVATATTKEGLLFYPQREGELKDDYNARLDKVAYEQFLRDKALLNTFNHWALFKSDNSFGDQFSAIRARYQHTPLMEEPLMAMLDVSSIEGYTNLILKTSDLSGDQLNILHESLLKLMDKNIKKVDNPIDNERISSFFNQFVTVAFLQSGMDTKSAFSLTRIVPDAMYMRRLEGPVKDYVKHLDEIAEYNKKKGNKKRQADDSKTILDAVYKKFVDVNNFTKRKGRLRGKNLTTALTINDSRNHIKGITPRKGLPLSYESVVVAGNTEGLKGYTASSMDTVDKVKAKASDPNNVFVYNQGVESSNAVNNTLDSRIHHNAANTIGLPTLLNFSGGKNVVQDVDSKMSPEIKEAIDNAITSLKEAKADGKNLYFSMEGYGQHMIGFYKPHNKSNIGKETFLYLSEQLLENFNFINPGYLATTEGIEKIQSPDVQPISDELVLDFMKHCR